MSQDIHWYLEEANRFEAAIEDALEKRRLFRNIIANAYAGSQIGEIRHTEGYSFVVKYINADVSEHYGTPLCSISYRGKRLKKDGSESHFDGSDTEHLDQHEAEFRQATRMQEKARQIASC